MRLEGSYTALVTPFKDGVVDEPSLRALARRQVRAGTAGLVPCGSTGEAATLSVDEQRRVLEIVLAEARGRVPVVFGVASNDTARAADACRRAEAWGADALLVLAPYYNKPTQEGLFLHFKAAAGATRLPIMLYNIPGRTAVNVEPRTIARIAKACPNVVAVKEAAGSVDQVSEIVSLLPPSFSVLAGDDSLALPMMAVGARGVVSVASNVVPKETARLCTAALEGDMKGARRIHERLFGLSKALFLETNPAPVKAALARMGLCKDELRLPLVPMSEGPRRRLHRELARLGLV